MLSKVSKTTQQLKQVASLIQSQARAFSHGPYNPLHYKAHLVPEELPT
jgi:hypothetical protein